MSRIVYVNGEFLPEEDAKISVFDRGFLFADAVYEVSSVLNGKLIDNEGHMGRLKRSLDELEMQHPASAEEIETIQKTLIEKNGIEEGLVYLQVTRGAADRDFTYPANTKPSLVMFTQKKNLLESPQAKVGITVITSPDIRWQRRDIKTVSLLAASMAKMQAKAAGADDAWLVEDGFVTEGSSSNAYIVTQEGTVVTRHLGNEILAGITRKAALRLAEEEGIKIEERSFTVDEALAAAEAFVTSATTFVTPVVSIDEQKIGDGTPGPIAQKLRGIYMEEALKAS
ncbi:D-amino-acid transaminase [Cocleimonas sp. KMM 6892]|uniref:D-amino-acid transaminase n=1 Tax=unclassified Cocleimonas TaxID=2639732 RepID=UPI002DB65658|nr:MULTISPECIES: D-amino-acid transaminase [unclassified Cocleimonas]MEB8434221.1 D-amino-acid transaminase [Cocleimonas sp. KMM 6892]MEC4717160.1 D-amino-acid transaminase [Cocleimonas sp. KMM 6895]MEC4746493.1 D-amino-acid transaminase [Cocleimonas sp. KMM 6896]